jgi:ACS family glucarate transporter-like MFS transporter
MAYRRGWIAVFLFALAMINYIDRTTLSFAIGPISKEFGLGDIGKGYLFSSFLWTYTLFLIPAGMMVDRFGSSRVAAWGIGIWSFATALTGASVGTTSLLLTRLVMGAGEATSNPSGAKVVREWIPAGERGVITAVFNSGSYAGPALCALLAGGIIETWCQRRSDSRPAGRSKRRPVLYGLDQLTMISPVSLSTISGVAWFWSALADVRRRPTDCLRR